MASRAAARHRLHSGYYYGRGELHVSHLNTIRLPDGSIVELLGSNDPAIPVACLVHRYGYGYGIKDVVIQPPHVEWYEGGE